MLTRGAWLLGAVLGGVACGGAPAGTAADAAPIEQPARAFGTEGSTPAPPPPADPLPPDLDLGGGASGGAVFWALVDGASLVRFEERATDKVTAHAVTGLEPGEKLVGLDFRKKDKKLYALGSASRLYVLDRDTGKATAVGPEFVVPLVGSAFGFDFDPAEDVARVHSNTTQNLRVDPTTGWLAGFDLPLAYVESDAHEGETPDLVATAFDAPATGSPALYAIDAAQGTLTTLLAPEAGEVTTVGALDVTLTGVAGFDIGPDGAAWTALREAGATSLFRVDLKTGHATRVAPIAVTGTMTGLAVEAP